MENNQVGNEFELLPQKDESTIELPDDQTEEGKENNAMDNGTFKASDSFRPMNGAKDLFENVKIRDTEVIDIDDDDVGNENEDDDVDQVPSDPDNCFARGVRKIKSSITGFLDKYKRRLKIGCYVVLLLLYMAYFCYAMYYSFTNARALFAMTVCVVLCVIYAFIRNNFGGEINKVICQPLTDFCDKHWSVIRWISAIMTVALTVTWLIIDTSKNPANMMSFVGLVVVLLFTFVFSKYPDKIRWRPVLWGLVLQIILALLILRTRFGLEAFRLLGEQITIFLDYTEAGSKFVFGSLWHNHYFAFKVMPLVLYLGSVIAVLYHIGLVQIVITKLAWLLQFTMHTTACESLAAAGSIFLSMAEAPMLIGPYIPAMSVSELHAVATAGYTTIAGSVLGAGIAFGISPSNLITASVMSAPAALAVSKLFYPEVKQKPSLAEHRSAKIRLPEYQNVIDAIAGGAMAAVPIAVNICANFIVFLALLEFLNTFLSWAGGMVGYPHLSFELVCAWVFMPIAYLMGVDWEDCFLVGELIGMKIVTSVLISFKKLAVILENRQLGLNPSLSPRSELIATYALCGFSHIAGIGMTMGTLLGLAPHRSKDINAVVVRAMIAGNAANFLTACIAGILYEGEHSVGIGNSTAWNVTENTTALYTIT
ncbi:solute carrier family 28 member 3-like [Ptychodera flava]|uniref:solute carrier family 28 member 3-like n=1 Tax=Ptychodera flava TaxID=63121 RepID=UPI00396A0453